MRVTGSKAYHIPPSPTMPVGLVELMEGLTKEVLKHNPSDIYAFCAGHMEQLLEKRDGPTLKKPLPLDEKIARVQEKGRQRAEKRRQEYNKNLQQVNNSNVNYILPLEVPQINRQESTPTDVNSTKDKTPAITPQIVENISRDTKQQEDAEEKSSVVEVSHESKKDNLIKEDEINISCANDNTALKSNNETKENIPSLDTSALTVSNNDTRNSDVIESVDKKVTPPVTPNAIEKLNEFVDAGSDIKHDVEANLIVINQSDSDKISPNGVDQVEIGRENENIPIVVENHVQSISHNNSKEHKDQSNTEIFKNYDLEKIGKQDNIPTVLISEINDDFPISDNNINAHSNTDNTVQKNSTLKIPGLKTKGITKPNNDVNDTTRMNVTLNALEGANNIILKSDNIQSSNADKNTLQNHAPNTAAVVTADIFNKSVNDSNVPDSITNQITTQDRKSETSNEINIDTSIQNLNNDEVLSQNHMLKPSDIEIKDDSKHDNLTNVITVNEDNLLQSSDNENKNNNVPIINEKSSSEIQEVNSSGTEAKDFILKTDNDINALSVNDDKILDQDHQSKISDILISKSVNESIQSNPSNQQTYNDNIVDQNNVQQTSDVEIKDNNLKSDIIKDQNLDDTNAVPIETENIISELDNHAVVLNTEDIKNIDQKSLSKVSHIETKDKDLKSDDINVQNSNDHNISDVNRDSALKMSDIETQVISKSVNDTPIQISSKDVGFQENMQKVPNIEIKDKDYQSDRNIIVNNSSIDKIEYQEGAIKNSNIKSDDCVSVVSDDDIGMRMHELNTKASVPIEEPLPAINNNDDPIKPEQSQHSENVENLTKIISMQQPNTMEDNISTDIDMLKTNTTLQSNENEHNPNSTIEILSAVKSSELVAGKEEDIENTEHGETNLTQAKTEVTKPLSPTILKSDSILNLPTHNVDSDISTLVTENISKKAQGDSELHVDANIEKIASPINALGPSNGNDNDGVKQEETNLIQDDNKVSNNVDLETAAVTVQNVFRNFLFKRDSTFEDTPNDEDFMDDEDINKEECDFPVTSPVILDRRSLGITRMDTVLQTVNEEKSLSLSTDDSSTLSSAATIIQAHVRGFLVRNRLNSNKTVSTNSLAASNSNEPSITSLEADNEQHKSKTVLNIHIVPEGENYLSRDESLITSMELSLDGSPPSSINLHPLGYDKSERRKQLKREDAIQSISPPSNNSGKLSEDFDSVKELPLNDNDIVTENKVNDNNHDKEELVTEKEEINSTKIEQKNIVTETLDSKVENSETTLETKRKSLVKMNSDEMDVVTPFMSNENATLIHSGEFHDAVLPTSVSRCDTSVVSEFKNVLAYFLLWNHT